MPVKQGVCKGACAVADHHVHPVVKGFPVAAHTSTPNQESHDLTRVWITINLNLFHTDSAGRQLHKLCVYWLSHCSLHMALQTTPSQKAYRGNMPQKWHTYRRLAILVSTIRHRKTPTGGCGDHRFPRPVLLSEFLCAGELVIRIWIIIHVSSSQQYARGERALNRGGTS